MSHIPTPPLNYLPYPIRENGHFGFEYDAKRDMEIYLARTSQPAFNIIALLDSRLRLRRFPARVILIDQEIREIREKHDPLFRRVFRSLPTIISLTPPHFTLGDAALHMPPDALYEIMRRSEVARKAPDCFLSNEQMQELVESIEVRAAVDIAQKCFGELSKDG